MQMPERTLLLTEKELADAVEVGIRSFLAYISSGDLAAPAVNPISVVALATARALLPEVDDDAQAEVRQVVRVEPALPQAVNFVL